MSMQNTIAQLPFSNFAQYVRSLSAQFNDALAGSTFKTNLDLNGIKVSDLQTTARIETDEDGELSAILIELHFKADQAISSDLDEALLEAFEIVCDDLIDLSHPSAQELSATLSYKGIWTGELKDIVQPIIVVAN